LHIPAVLRSCVARFLRRAGTDANCWPQTPRRHFRSRLVCRQSINARLFCSLFSRLIVEMCEPFGKRPFKSSGFLDTSTLAKIRVREESFAREAASEFRTIARYLASSSVIPSLVSKLILIGIEDREQSHPSTRRISYAIRATFERNLISEPYVTARSASSSFLPRSNYVSRILLENRTDYIAGFIFRRGSHVA